MNLIVSIQMLAKSVLARFKNALKAEICLLTSGIECGRAGSLQPTERCVIYRGRSVDKFISTRPRVLVYRNQRTRGLGIFLWTQEELKKASALRAK
jgi:hypothetical protein